MNKIKNNRYFWITLIGSALLGGGFVGAQKVVSVVIDTPITIKVEERVKQKMEPVKEDIKNLQDDVKNLQWDATFIKMALQKNMSKQDIEELEAKTTLIMGGRSK